MHTVGTVPGTDDGETFPIILIQRDELTTDEDSSHVNRGPAAVLVHGIRVSHSDIPSFLEMLQEAVKCVAQ